MNRSLAARIAVLALVGCPSDPVKTDAVSKDAAEDSGDGVEPLPGSDAAWQREEVASPGPVTFTELQYNSPNGADWVELHNPMAFDMDVSWWFLSGGVSYTFAQGTVIPAGGYLVVAADPAALAAETGFANAYGPFTGTLDGERVELWNNGGRRIDSVGYATEDPWPVAPDGSGASLAKVQADSASDRAENWAASRTLGGSPGEANDLDPLTPPTTVALVDLEASWAYDVSGNYPDADWASATYDDSGWLRADALFYAGAAQADVLATAWATADNYYGLYLGSEAGSDLRLVGLDPDGDWTTADPFDVEVRPTDHLYLAAWEAPWDYGGPQMTIAEVDLGDRVVGTGLDTFEWVLGANGACPGAAPADPPPEVDELWALVQEANDDATWAPPAVAADRTSDPWGWAVSGAFSEGTDFVWADTFSDTSVTNTENTYVLLRSAEPLVGVAGTTEIDPVPTTATFRTAFTFDGEPSAAELTLECRIDDGAVVYLNGVEVHRENMPAGAVNADTLATAPVEGEAVYVEVSAASLVRGENVLAVELHQARANDATLLFGCALTATIQSSTSEPALQLNEVAPGGEAPFWVELRGVRAQDTEGMVLRSQGGGEMLLEGGTLAAGELRSVELDFAVQSGEVLYLYDVDESELLDAVRVRSRARARDDAGDWRTPTEASPGAANTVALETGVVIHELQYHRAPEVLADGTIQERSEEWIELYNRGAAAVDLSGWRLVDAVAYSFEAGTVLEAGDYLVVANDAAALRAEHPDITVVGDFAGGLANSGDRVLLLDANDNPADEVRYHDNGRWPSAADGRGGSLELRNPEADNSAAEAWAASNELDRSAWVNVRYRGTAEASAVGPDGQWHELVLGLLGEGEVLLDDVSVVVDPDGAARELVRNGSFENTDRWRILGNHRHSEVVPDPSNAGNSVLRLLATGPTGHMHNHAETTLTEALATTEYEISYRARWVSGSNQLNSRLYFNRLPRTARIEQPTASGTPGAPNSTAEDNLGPTFARLSQGAAVPPANAPVEIAVSIDDPDGVASATLWAAVDGAGWDAETMVEEEPGRFRAELAGQPAGTIVQFYVEAEDSAGATATFPAEGPDSRALLRFDDGGAATNGLHNFRILLTQADSDWLHDDVNLMSDDAIGATVVVDEREVFYDVGLRLKGSQRGRPETPRLGYGVQFNREQPYRGSHGSVLIDRSEGVGFGQREVLQNLMMTAAGSVSGEYNDLTHVITPLPEHTGAAELQLDRFSDLVLGAQFEDGETGAMFEYELIYYPYTTVDGTAEGLKLPAPDAVVGTYLTDLGTDPEDYRWNFLLQNTEVADDFSDIIDLGQAFGGPDFLGEVESVIDVDQWLRAFAFATLSGAVDNYGSDHAQHNARFYVRPSDGRVLYFPHDLDFFGSYAQPVIGNSDLARLLANPDYERAYYGHLEDLVGSTYNATYMAPWCAQLGDLLSGQDIASHCAFIGDRANWVMQDSPDAVLARYPSVDFRITTESGADFSTPDTEVVLEGIGWIDVRTISLGGPPLTVTWNDQSWEVTVPLEPGPNDLVLVATDLRGAVVATDSIVVTRTGG